MNQKKLIVAMGFALGLASQAQAQQLCSSDTPATTPKTGFVDNADGTVTHRRTGLVWQRCAEGQTLSAGTCQGTPRTLTWAQAIEAAKQHSKATKHDWRLPNIKELLSIVEENCTAPSINLAVFPATSPAYFWSAFTSANDPGYAWYVYFDNGYAQSHDKKEVHQVRLVRQGN